MKDPAVVQAVRDAISIIEEANLRLGLGSPRRNPEIPYDLIADPHAPIPSGMGKRDRKRLVELRMALQQSIAARPTPPGLKTPEDISAYLAPIIAPLKVESLIVMGFNSHMQPIAPPVIISRGDVDGTDAGPRMILRAVLVMGAVHFAVAHNHPSGVLTASPGDIAVTKRLIAAGKALDTPLQDHLIIIHTGEFLSFRRDFSHLWM
jgi:DNA repair protein RadC